MNNSFSNKVQLKELLDILRCGLAALVPIVERAGIPWMEGDAYDDWDAIAATLYEQLVVNIVHDSVEVVGDLAFPEYDTLYPSYESMAYFEVFALETTETLGPFVGFESSEPNFNNVKYAIIDDGVSFSTTTTHKVNFLKCGIRLRLPSETGNGLSELTLEGD